MLSLDLFTSKFEQHIHEGAVDSLVEQDQPDPQEKIPNNINQFNTEDNRALVKRIWAQISQHAINDTAGWLTLEWPNQPAATLSRNQVWTVINKIAKMPATQRNAFALSTLGDRNAFLTWMNGLKIISRPAPKKDAPRGQQSLDLKELDQKKSSEDPKFKSTRLDRLKTQARARHPAAGSDTEAMVADFVDQQDKDQEAIARLRQTTQRQRELIKKNDSLDADQQRTIADIEKEINDVEANNSTLATTIQQMQRANTVLQQKLDQMRGRAAPAPTAPELGVSVATDKPATQPAPATTPPIDTRARQYAQQLRKQLNQLQTMVALKAPEDQSQLKQDIDALKAQLAKLQQREPIATATQATVGGQAADVMPARGSSDKETDDGVIDLTGIDDVLSQFRKPAKKSAKKKSKKEPEFELSEADAIPLKSVVQGYNIDYDPRTRRVTVSRGGQVIGSGVNRLNSPKYHLTLINRIIDRAEDDKYPTDIDVRDVALPMKAEGSVFGQQDFDTQMDLAKLKSQLTQPKPAQSAPASAEPQPVPARLSDLQSKKQRIDNLASIKQDIEKLQARATRGGRMLPRGLAADLEDYFTVADIDTAYDDMMAKYQKQLGALQQYLGMRKVLWTPRKDVHEMKATELQEGGPETWTVHFTDGTTTRVRVPSDETDPAQVRAFFAKKGKTVKKFDYGFTTEPTAGPGPERHEPGSGTARSARTGEELPEGEEISVTGQPIKQEKGYYSIWAKKGNRWTPVTKYSDRKEAEEIKRGLEKRGIEVIIREGRAGYNPMQTEKDWHEVERYLSGMINDRTLDAETRAEARQRYLEKRKEAQQKGWAK